MQCGSLDQLKRFAANGYLYAFMDSAYAPMALPCIREVAPERVTRLITPTPNEEIPMLVHVDEHVLEIILSTVGNEPWGVFAMSKASAAELWRHFRRFLVVQLPDGDKTQFRFYDPRVLPVYVRCCEEWELRKFFGPVRGFGVPSDQAVSILQYQPAPGADPARGGTDPNFSLVWHLRPEQADLLGKRRSQPAQLDLFATLLGELPH